MLTIITYRRSLSTSFSAPCAACLQDLDPANKKWHDDEIAKGELMICLGKGGDCQAAFCKDDGCNYVECMFCETPHCWQTKKLRSECGRGHGCH